MSNGVVGREVYRGTLLLSGGGAVSLTPVHLGLHEPAPHQHPKGLGDLE